MRAKSGEKVMMQLKRTLTTATGCIGLFAISMAMAGNGIEFDEFDSGGELYIDCLGEVVAFEEHIKTAYHEFETPSGTYHVVDKWTFYLTATGLTSGRQWYGTLPSPGQYSAGPGEVNQFAIRGVVKGITPDTPNFAWTGYYKSTVNANGVLVVERGSDFSARCLGHN
jgi:hypothetical protein